MAVQPYSTVSISGYNSSPPPDDGTQTTANLVQWSKHKTKIGDPIKTLAEAINTQCVNAFATMALQQTTAITTSATMAESNWNKLQLKTATGGKINYPDPTALENGWYNYVYNAATEDLKLQATATNAFRNRNGAFASEVLLPYGRGIKVLNTATVFLPLGLSMQIDDVDMTIAMQMFN